MSETKAEVAKLSTSTQGMVAAPALPQGVAIRDARESDVASIFAIYKPHVESGMASMEEKITLEEMQARFAKFQAAKFPYIVAVDTSTGSGEGSASGAGAVVGYAYASAFRERIGYRFTCENSIYIAEVAQRRGVGRALLTELIARCKALGLKQMIAVISDPSGNKGSTTLHASTGFRVVGTFKAICTKFDKWVDVLFMQLEL